MTDGGQPSILRDVFKSWTSAPVKSAVSNLSMSLLFNMFAAVCQALSRSTFLSDHDVLVPLQVLSTTHNQIVNSDLQEGASTLEVDVKKVQEELIKQGARIH